MHDIDLKTLRLLVAVCDHQNIRHAAAQEHIEPSAISKRMAQLEHNLGTPLLVRSRKGAHPTPAGQALLEHARGILFAVDRIEGDMAAFKGGIKGHVRVAASASAIAESLLDDLAGFMRQDAHRDIKIDIEERFSRDIVNMVRDGTASIGICWSQADTAGLESLPYREDRLVLAVPRGHPLARRKALRFVETLDHEHVGLQPAAAVSSMLRRAAAQVGRAPNYRVVVSNFDAAFRVVAAGLAVSVVPGEVSTSYVRSGAIELVPLKDSWAARQFAILHRSAPELTPAASKLVSFLSSQAANRAV